MREQGTSDPRDRIYAATSLLPFEGSQTLNPDYTLTEHEIYEKVAFLFLRYRSLRYLQYCQPHLKSSGLPSWIPNWSEPRLTPPLQEGMFTHYYRRYNASAKVAPKYHCTRTKDNNSHLFLVATGRTIDRVATITCNYHLKSAQSPHWERAALTCAVDQTEVNDKSSDADSAYRDIPELNEPRNNSVGKEEEMRRSRYKSGCSLWEAYIRTLIADRTTSDQKSDSIFLVLDMGRKVKRYRNSHFTWSPYLTSRLQECVSVKAFITTETQYIGLGPEYAESGDYIVVLHGMEVPLILRKSKNQDIYYIIGEAYVHGVMEGELFQHRSVFEEQKEEGESFTIC